MKPEWDDGYGFPDRIRRCLRDFHAFVFLMSRDPVKTIFNYPPAIIERCRQLHHLLERSAHRLCTVVRGELV